MKTSTTAACFTALALLLANVTLRAQSPPANDDFANRQSLPAETTVSVSGTNVGATQEAFEITNGAGFSPGEGPNQTKTVWYDWLPPVSGTVHVSFVDFNEGAVAYLMVFQGGAIPTLSQLVTQGYVPVDPTDGLPAPADFKVTAGQEYTLSVGNTDVPCHFILMLTLTADATPPPTPVASVTAKGKADRSTGTPGKFVVSLSSAASADVTVAYKTGGSAVNGTDYKGLSGTLVIPAGETSATLKIKPRAATGPSGPTVAVKVKLEAGDGYTVGGAGTAKVKISD